MEILLMLDSYFFSMDTVDKLIAEADADGDGEVHYVEFAAWLAGTECDALLRNLFAASLATTYDMKNTKRKAASSNMDDLYVKPECDGDRYDELLGVGSQSLTAGRSPPSSSH